VSASTDLKGRYYLAAFLMDAALATGGIAVPLLAKHVFHASPLFLGLLAATGAGAYVLFTPLAGRVSDRLGRHAMMPLGVALYGVTYTLIGFCPGLGLLFLLVVVSGASQAMFWPALEAAIADGTSRRLLPVRVGIFNVSWCSSIVLGTWLGGRLHDAGARYAFFFAAGVAGLLLLVMAVTLRSGQGRRAALVDEGEPPGPVSLISSELRQTFMHMAWGANFVAWGVLGTMRALFAADATVRLSFTGQKAGLLVAAISAAQTAMFVLLMVFHGWRYRFWLLALAQGCMLAGAGLVGLSVSSAPLAFAFFLIGAGAGITYTSSIYYSLEGLHARGAKSGLHEAFLGAGGFAAPTLGGWLATATGDLRTPYFMCVVVVAIGLAWQTLMYSVARRQKDS
jgi:DHA1 family multidrug resistance protein-like MFS transporter